MQFRSVVPSIIVLCLSVFTSALTALMVHKDVRALEQREFTLEAAEVKDAVSDALNTYELALRAGAGLFRGVGDVDKAQWRQFVDALELEREFPGIRGLGYTAAIASEDLPAFEARQRANGDVDFSVRPAGKRDFYTAISLIEPQDDRNERALGYDMFSEQVRRSAMERARDTGEPALTRKVTLVQETNADTNQPGILIYLAVYSAGAPPVTIDERRQRLKGFMFEAFRMGDLLQAVLQAQTPDALKSFRVELYDGAEETAGNRLFGNGVAFPTGVTAMRTAFALDAGGSRWTISVSGTGALLHKVDKSKPWFVFAGGLIISLLISAFTAFQALVSHDLASSRQALAREVNERKKAQEAAEMANSELIHRVKNTLAVVSAIASQTVRYSATLEEFSKAYRERLASLARVQDLLRPNSAAYPDLESLIRQLLEPYTQSNPDMLVVQGPLAEVARNDVVLFSLTFNELATNATKYGAWSVPNGRVLIIWENAPASDTCQGGLALTWEERGGPRSPVAGKKGFGSAVMQFAIQRAMGGAITCEYLDEGVKYTIMLPPRAAGSETAEPIAPV